MDATTRTTPASLWIVGALALLWNLLGVAAFAMELTMSAEGLQALSPERQAINAATPAWLYLFYGTATIGGVLGSLGLLLRRRWALPVYLVALIGLVLHVLAGYAMTPVWQFSGPRSLVFPVLLLVVATLLWLFARRVAKRGVLR